MEIKKDLNEICIISDMDGTLLSKPNGIHKKNIEAINKFINMGGNFTIATGRTYYGMKPFIKILNIKLPVILYNGSAIYNFENETFLWSVSLDKSIRKIIKNIANEFSDIGIVICKDKNVYITQTNEKIKEHLTFEHIPVEHCNIDNIDDGWLKILIASDAFTINYLDKYLNSFKIDNIRIVKSASNYISILPKDVSKGVALENLLAITNISSKNIISIGDYYNDIEMFQKSNISICVNNAPDEVKKTATYIIGNCEDGAVADFINQIVN